MAAPRLTRTPLAALRRRVRRHRRPIAAILAAAAMLTALTALRAPAPASTTPGGTAGATPADPSMLQPGESSVPILLASSAVASVLQPGDVIDLVAPSASGGPETVAAGARVLDRPATGGGLAPSSGGLVVVAVSAAEALTVAVSSSRDDLTVVIRSPFAGVERSQ